MMQGVAAVVSDAITVDVADDEMSADRRRWLILVAVSLGMMLGVFNIALVNIAVPALIRDLNTSVSSVSWVLNSFNITQAVLLLSFGRLAARQDLAATLKDEIIHVVVRNAEKDGAAKAEAGAFFDPVAGLTGGVGGLGGQTAVQSVAGGIAAIAKHHAGRAYVWSFLAGAIAVVLNLPLAFLLGRRLGYQKAGSC